MGRRLGQHFLNRKSILNRIAGAACGERAPLVIEIGAGRGALTESLLERANRVVAIEIDPVLVQYLRQKFRASIDSDQLLLIERDILKIDLAAWGPATMTGNLPYFITSPILERLFAVRGSWDRAVLLIQSEVADRIVAGPGSRDYGYLSVMIQAQAHAERLFEVPRDAFRPPPKVDSAVIRLEPRIPEVDNLQDFLKFTGGCFRFKRKTLRNNLAGLYNKARIESLVGPKDRAEQLGIRELAKLYESLTTQSEVVYPR